MKLYNSFCYSDIQAAADSISSNLFLGDGQVVESVTVLDADTVQVSVNRFGTTGAYTLTLLDCSKEGFDNTFFGVSPADAQTTAWLSIAVLVSAWAIKTLRRGAT